MRVLAVVVAVAAAAAGRAESVALLPCAGAGADADKKAMDETLRQTLKGQSGIELQAAVETRRQLLSAADMNLLCGDNNVPCLVKFGALAGVTLVWVPVLAGTDLTVRVIDVDASAQRREAKGNVAQLRSIVDEALGRKPIAFDPPPPDTGAPTTSPPPPQGNAATSPAAVDGSTPAPSIGIVLAGVSGAVAALGIGGGVTCELLFNKVVGDLDAKTRANVIRPAGIGLWATGALGAVGLASGIVVAVVLSKEPE